MHRVYGTLVPPEVMDCLEELYDLESGDALEFNYIPRISREPIWFNIFSSINQLPDGLEKNFFQEQRMAFSDCDEPDFVPFSDEDVSGVCITIPNGIYNFLILGENGAMAITYQNIEEGLLYFYLPFGEFENAEEKWYWQQVEFPVE